MAFLRRRLEIPTEDERLISQRVEHDKRIFEEANAILTERHFLDMLNNLVGGHDITRADVSIIHRYLDYFEGESNQYALMPIREASSDFVKKLSGLSSFTGKHFFTWPRTPESSGYALYPELCVDRAGSGRPEEMERYERRARELSEIAFAAEESYSVYRRLVKDNLIV